MTQPFSPTGRAATLASRKAEGYRTVEAVVPGRLRDALLAAYPGERLGRALLLAAAAQVNLPSEAVAARKAGRRPKVRTAPDSGAT